jgi:hypothetical protein
VTLLQAKATAVRLFRRTDLRFTKEMGLCFIRTGTGAEFGRGGSWLEAMRDAALHVAKVDNVEGLVAKQVAIETPHPVVAAVVRPFAWAAVFIRFVAWMFRRRRLA